MKFYAFLFALAFMFISQMWAEPSEPIASYTTLNPESSHSMVNRPRLKEVPDFTNFLKYSRSPTGRHVAQILDGNKIKWTEMVDPNGYVTADVTPKDSDRARYLLAQTCLSENLNIILLVHSQTDKSRWIQISPRDAIIRYHKAAEQSAAANP
jgi:hypothetical protein